MASVRSLPRAAAERKPGREQLWDVDARRVRAKFELPSLPETRDEIIAIAKALKADPVRDVLFGADATKPRLEKLDLKDRRVVAFATHGLVPGEIPGLTQPALALSPVGDDDGLLTFEDVMKLKLDADWVVLFACNTAAGDGAGAEALSGLGRAFFYSGTRSVLATHWAVETESARELVSSIFESNGADPKLPRAKALQQAMIGLMERGAQRSSSGTTRFTYAHPAFWAPYALFGDGGR